MSRDDGGSRPPRAMGNHGADARPFSRPAPISSKTTRGVVFARVTGMFDRAPHREDEVTAAGARRQRICRLCQAANSFSSTAARNAVSPWPDEHQDSCGNPDQALEIKVQLSLGFAVHPYPDLADRIDVGRRRAAESRVLGFRQSRCSIRRPGRPERVRGDRESP